MMDGRVDGRVDVAEWVRSRHTLVLQRPLIVHLDPTVSYSSVTFGAMSKAVGDPLYPCAESRHGVQSGSG